ncbi:MAG: hypothetical protein WA144_15445 [Candidatus Methanoperedens sp.]
MATLRELLLRDRNDILYYLSGGAGGTAPRYPYYIGDIIFYDTSSLYSGYLTLKATPEYQEIILGQVPPPPPSTGSSSLILPLIILIAYLIMRKL